MHYLLTPTLFIFVVLLRIKGSISLARITHFGFIHAAQD